METEGTSEGAATGSGENLSGRQGELAIMAEILRMEARIMAKLQDVVDAVAQDQAAVEAAAARVSADLQALTQTVIDLQAQIAAGAGITEADLDPLVTGLQAISLEADAIDAPAPPPPPS